MASRVHRRSLPLYINSHSGIHLFDHALGVFANHAHKRFARNVRIAELVGDSARRAHDRAQAVFVEALRRGLGATALRSITRHQDQGLRHKGAQPAALFRKRCADHRADGAVSRLADQSAAPFVQYAGDLFI